MRTARLILTTLLLLLGGLAAVLATYRMFRPSSNPEAPAEAPKLSPAVEGTLVFRSVLPDPTNNQYPDCNFTAVMEVDACAAGLDLPKRVLVVIPGFRARTPRPEAALAVGDRIAAEGLPFLDADKALQAIQQADQVEDIDLPIFLVTRARKVTAFSPLPNPPGHPHQTVETPTQALPERSPVQEAAIKESMAHIHVLLDRHGGDWDAWYEELAPVREALVSEKLPYFGEAHALRSFSSLFSQFQPDDPSESHLLEAMQQFENAVRRQGVDLILAPFPDRDLLAIDHLFPTLRPSDGIWNPYRLRRNLHLLEQGVELLDATPSFRSPPENCPPLFYWESADPHPAGGAALLLADALAERLGQYTWEPPLSHRAFRLSWKRIKAPPAGPAPAPFALPHHGPVVMDAAHMPPRDNPLSPILLIGDSFLRSPNGGASYVLRHKLSHDFDSFVRTSGALDMPRHIARAKPDLWHNRKVAVFLFNEPYIELARGHWAMAGLTIERRARYQRLRQQGDLMFRFNSPEDFGMLKIREPEVTGSYITPKYMFLPPSPKGYHLDVPPSVYRGDRNHLLHFAILCRQPQTLDLLLDSQTVGEIVLTKHENRINTIIDPQGHPATLTLRIPPGGGNFFIRNLEVFVSSVKN